MRSSFRARHFGCKAMTLAAICMLWCLASLQAQSEAKSGEAPGVAPPASAAAGRRVFASTCAGCHGLDARGGERAPDILAMEEVQRMSEVQVSQIVREGTRSKTMPAFGNTLDAAQIHDVAIYLRSLLQSHLEPAAVPGDAAAGKTLFFGKAGCADCHMVVGAGGFLGEDLTSYAESRSISEIRDAVTDPGNNSQHRQKVVSVVTRGGEHFTGIVRNEDNFSLQLQTPDGAFHLLVKSELEQTEYQKQPLMPADYSQRLSAGELNDLISFLMRTAAANGNTQPHGRNRKDPDED
jgi:cytochrome c oxidase cbb3-type subunit III